MRNVAKLVTIPTPKYKINRGLEVAQARELLTLARDERLYALYVLALLLGLRRGELLGLHWRHVDLDGGSLEVAWTLQRVDGKLRPRAPENGALRADGAAPTPRRGGSEGAQGTAGTGAGCCW